MPGELVAAEIGSPIFVMDNW